jgi:hypothetical protein
MLGVVMAAKLIGAQGVGFLRLVGRVTWQSGGGGGSADFDLPAGGAAVALPAAESLNVDCYAEGTSASIYDVSAAVAAVRAPFSRPVVRTRRDHLPMADSLSVPGFARAVTLLSDTPLAFGGVEFQLLEEAHPPGLPIFEAAASAGPHPVVGGATHYLMNGIAGQTITSVWELCL